MTSTSSLVTLSEWGRLIREDPAGNVGGLPVIDGPTPESFWMYPAPDPGPLPEFLRAAGWTTMQWESFSPGMRRAIKREFERRPIAQEAPV